MIIRQARDTDEEGIRSLFKASFHNELSHQEWEWKYRRSYLGSSAFVAEDDGTIVAHYGGFRMRFWNRGRTHDVYQGCDVMTHPAYRARLFARKGIIVRTAEAFYEANPMELIFGFPSERHARLMTLQLKWEPHLFITILKKETAGAAQRRSLILRADQGWERIGPEELDRVWRETRGGKEVTIDKGGPYLHWRYRDNPRGGYELIGFRGVIGRLKAFAVIRVLGEELSVLDLCVPVSAHFSRVLNSLERVAFERGVRSISVWMNPVDRDFASLRASGYVSERGIPYTLRVFEGSGIAAPLFLERYHYSKGDYDAA